MATKAVGSEAPSALGRERISYVRQMLGELAQVARAEKQDMLVYLLEMAFTEAGDVLTRTSRPTKIERNHAAGMAMQPAGKV